MKTHQLINPPALSGILIFVFLLSTPFLLKVWSGNPLTGDKPETTTFSNGRSVKYLDLPIWQLKLLGIDCSSKGIFYKNQNPEWKKEQRRYEVLGLYLGDENYCTNVNYHDTEEEDFSSLGKPGKIMKIMETTSNSFDPVMVTDLDGHRTWDAYSVYEDNTIKLIPVRINMADLQMKKRKDFVVFWFKPTESLKKVLSGYVDTDNYAVIP
jgi:hypothetical protein